MSEGTKEFNAQEEIGRLNRIVEDHEIVVEKLELAIDGMAQLVHQMDTFLREMIKIGVFEDAIKRLQAEEKPKLII